MQTPSHSELPARTELRELIPQVIKPKQTFSESFVENNNNFEFQQLLDHIPRWAQEACKGYQDSIEELIFDLHSPFHVRLNDDSYIYFDKTVNPSDLTFITTKVGGFKSNKRQGIPLTLHRVSKKESDREVSDGITIRYGRFIHGVAEPLEPYLDEKNSIVLIGSPGSGKSTLLRGMARILGDKYYSQAVIVDTSGDLAGHGDKKHYGVGLARRFSVAHPEMQAAVMENAVRNHTPRVLIADEIGYARDVDNVADMASKGIGVVCSCHGDTLLEVLEDEKYQRLFGNPDFSQRKRTTKPTFNVAILVVKRGHYRLFLDLTRAIDGVLGGEHLEGVDIIL